MPLIASDAATADPVLHFAVSVCQRLALRFILRRLADDATLLVNLEFVVSVPDTELQLSDCYPDCSTRGFSGLLCEPLVK
jgi:hypothetical protein